MPRTFHLVRTRAKDFPRIQMSCEVLDFPDLYEASTTELQDGLQGGLFTSVDLVNVRNKITLKNLRKLIDENLGIPRADR